MKMKKEKKIQKNKVDSFTWHHAVYNSSYDHSVPD